MQVRLLGSVDVLVDRQVRPVRGIRRKALLAVLALHPGEVVSTDRLIGIVWGDAPTVTANAVQCQVSYLRRLIGDSTAIRTSAPGYMLAPGDDVTDAATAARLIDKGRRCTDPYRGAALLREALAFWRGKSLADVAGLEWLSNEGDRLDELHWQAELALVERRLEMGEHVLLVPDLERMAQDHPFEESIHAHLMLALYRAGRQVEALRTYQRLRDTLRDELGLDPGSSLRELEAAILRQAPELTPAPARIVTATPPPRPQAPPPAADRTALARAEHALTVEGDLGAARRLFDAAFRAAEQAGDRMAEAWAALGLGGLWVAGQRTASASRMLTARLQHALDGVDPGSALALHLRARLLCESDLLPVRHFQVLACLHDSRRCGEPVAQAEVLNLVHHRLLAPHYRGLRESLATDLIAHSAITGRRIDRLLGLLWHTTDLFLDGDPRAEDPLAELDSELAIADHLAIGHVTSAMRVMLAIRAGELEEAERLAGRCAELGAAAGNVDAEFWHGAQLVTIRWFQDRLAELWPMIDTVLHNWPLGETADPLVSALAVAAASAGEHQIAEHALARLRGDGLSSLARTNTWLSTLFGAAEAAYLLDDAQTAQEAYELLSPFAHLPAISSMGVTCLGPTQYALGTAALAMGDTTTAIEHLSSAIGDGIALSHQPAVSMARRRRTEALAAASSGVRAAQTAQRRVARTALSTPGSRHRASLGAG